MSHKKNMQNFDQVIAVCTGLGGNYNPGNQNLQVDALIGLMNNASAADALENQTRSQLEIATNNREVMFDGVPKLAGRILGELKSSNVMEQTIDDARTIIKRMSSRAASRDPVATAATTAEVKPKRRARGLDYISMAGHFSKLLQNVTDEPNYQPVTEDLKVGALQTLLINLQAANHTVTVAKLNHTNARAQRDSVLYLATGNLYDTTQAVKQKMKAMYGTSSPTFKEISKIKVHREANI